MRISILSSYIKWCLSSKFHIDWVCRIISSPQVSSRICGKNSLNILNLVSTRYQIEKFSLKLYFLQPLVLLLQVLFDKSSVYKVRRLRYWVNLLIHTLTRIYVPDFHTLHKLYWLKHILEFLPVFISSLFLYFMFNIVIINW